MRWTSTVDFTNCCEERLKGEIYCPQGLLCYVRLQELVIFVVFTLATVTEVSQIGFISKEFLSYIIQGEVVKAVAEKAQLAKLKIFRFA